MNGTNVENRLYIGSSWTVHVVFVFRLVVLKCMFMFKSNSLCETEKRVHGSVFQV